MPAVTWQKNSVSIPEVTGASGVGPRNAFLTSPTTAYRDQYRKLKILLFFLFD